MAKDVVSAGEGARLLRFVGCGARAAIMIAAVIALGAAAAAQDVSPQRIETGAKIFARNCSPCHGPRMRDPESAFDLRTFPHDAHDRFIASVTRGKNQMPPWGDLLEPEEIEALWAYVVAGEK
jgi:mono/diheme cytochrome c family protein